MKLQTNEPKTNEIIVSIEVKETEYRMVIVEVGGKLYAQFQNATISDIDLPKLIKWAEENAFEGTYLSDAYVSQDLMLSEFASYDFDEDAFDKFSADSHIAIIADHIY